MGSYTKMSLDVVLRPDTPEEILTWIQHFLYHGDHSYDVHNGEYKNNCACDESIEPEPFIGCRRWDRMLSWGHGREHRTFEKVQEGVHVTTLTEIKNYDHELEKFLHWIQPYVVNAGQDATFATTDSEEGFDAEFYCDGRIKLTQESYYDSSAKITWDNDYLKKVVGKPL